MKSDLIKEAYEELAVLKASDEENERDQDRVNYIRATNAARRGELNTFIRIAKTVGASAPAIYTEEMANRDLAKGFKKATLEIESAKVQISSVAESMMTNGIWIQTRDIVDECERRNVHVSGHDMTRKIVRVSGILNKSNKFVGKRGKGWALKQLQIAPTKGEGQGVPAPQPSSVGSTH